MKSAPAFLGFIIGFAIVLILAEPMPVRAEILKVGSGEQFAGIAEAIAAAAAGDTIQVQPGRYVGSLVVDKSVTLEGVGKPTIMGTGTGSVLEVVADNCTIRGFAVTKSGSDLVKEDAGILLKSAGNTVEDNDLTDILFGIYLFGSANNQIRRNTIEGRQDLESGERGGGFHLWNSAGNVLEDNIVRHTRDGMYIQNSSRNVFRRNRVSDLRYGLHFMSSDDNAFEDNVFSENVAGAAIMYSQRIELRRNMFVHNRGFSSFGILYQDCRNCVTEENLVLNNATGIFLEGVRDSVFRRNVIAENDTALQIFSSSDENTFTENNFIGNINPLRMVGTKTNVTWQDANIGNYWSDYDGYDLDGDGFGDVPHKIQNAFDYLEGIYPRLRLYLNSPAAQSVVLAERSFPVLQQTKEFDNRPLMHPAEIDVPVVDRSSGGSAKWITLAVSLIMLAFSAIVVIRGSRP